MGADMIETRTADNGSIHASMWADHFHVHAWNNDDGLHALVDLKDAAHGMPDFTVHVDGSASNGMTVDLAFKLRRISDCPEVPTNAMIQGVIDAVIEGATETG